MRAAERGLPRFWLLGESLEEGHGKEWGGTSYCTNEHEKWASIPGLLGGGAQGPQEISTLLYSNLYCSKKRSTLSEANSLVWQNVTLPICRFNKTGFIAESWGTKKLASVEYNNKTVPWHGEGYGILCQISNLFTFDRYTQGERYHTFSWTGYLVDSVLNGYRGRGWQEEEEERTVYRKRNHMRYQGQQGRRQPFVYKIISNSNILANIFYPDKMLNNNNLKKCETNRK